MIETGNRNTGVVGLLAVILSCLVTSELLRAGLSGPEMAATAAAILLLIGTELAVRRRRHHPKSPPDPSPQTKPAPDH